MCSTELRNYHPGLSRIHIYLPLSFAYEKLTPEPAPWSWVLCASLGLVVGSVCRKETGSVLAGCAGRRKVAKVFVCG